MLIFWKRVHNHLFYYSLDGYQNFPHTLHESIFEFYFGFFRRSICEMLNVFLNPRWHLNWSSVHLLKRAKWISWKMSRNAIAITQMFVPAQLISIFLPSLYLLIYIFFLHLHYVFPHLKIYFILFFKLKP